MDPLTAVRHDTVEPHVADVPVLVKRTSELLAAGVPLTLLIDLAEDGGPRSTQRYRLEGGDAAWLTGVGSARGRRQYS